MLRQSIKGMMNVREFGTTFFRIFWCCHRRSLGSLSSPWPGFEKPDTSLHPQLTSQPFNRIWHSSRPDACEVGRYPAAVRRVYHQTGLVTGGEGAQLFGSPFKLRTTQSKHAQTPSPADDPPQNPLMLPFKGYQERPLEGTLNLTPPYIPRKNLIESLYTSVAPKQPLNNPYGPSQGSLRSPLLQPSKMPSKQENAGARRPSIKGTNQRRIEGSLREDYPQFFLSEYAQGGLLNISWASTWLLLNTPIKIYTCSSRNMKLEELQTYKVLKW